MPSLRLSRLSVRRPRWFGHRLCLRRGVGTGLGCCGFPLSAAFGPAEAELLGQIRTNLPTAFASARCSELPKLTRHMWQGLDSNQRPRGYEPRELTSCSTLLHPKTAAGRSPIPGERYRPVSFPVRCVELALAPHCLGILLVGPAPEFAATLQRLTEQ